MIGEVAKSAGEIGKSSAEGSSFNPDARAGETGKNEAATNSGYNPDTRMGKSEVSSPNSGEQKSYDPDKRVEKDTVQEQRGLSQEEKEKIKTETGWSDEITDVMSSVEEARIYQEAGLVEKEINGRPCLVNDSIDMNQKDNFGRTNQQRMEQGLAPLDKDGKPIELHHIGQKNDSPLAELTQEQHRGSDNYSVLHDTKKESEIDRGQFNNERSQHWQERAQEANHG